MTFANMTKPKNANHQAKQHDNACGELSFLQAGNIIERLAQSRLSVSLANWYAVKVQRNVTLLHRSKTTIRQPQVEFLAHFAAEIPVPASLRLSAQPVLHLSADLGQRFLDFSLLQFSCRGVESDAFDLSHQTDSDAPHLDV